MAAPADRLILGTRKGLLVLDRAKGEWRLKLHRSHDDGKTWACAGGNFPPIYSVRFA